MGVPTTVSRGDHSFFDGCGGQWLLSFSGGFKNDTGNPWYNKKQNLFGNHHLVD